MNLIEQEVYQMTGNTPEMTGNRDGVASRFDDHLIKFCNFSLIHIGRILVL